ncbi:hypothetical protein OF83DRAFT_1083004 [Amylostereum chailletii]|nr:hypothetical protein OF83DRAFT_1083004 [Amylostereum chailletii]
MCGRVVDMQRSSFPSISSTKLSRDDRQLPKDPSSSPLSASEDDDTSSSVGHPVIKKDKERDDSQLTVQALNTDGTPRRPMNAFMIFARRRRPQVSAENSLLRTGEISKILSKEWTTMPMSEKQFYLDQAKRLKDTFNSKYPDYVYRRRPNNSRKKRKPDAALSPSLDAAASGDATEGSPEAYSFEYPPDADVLGMPSLRAIGLSRFDHRVGIPSDYDDNVGPSSAHSSSSPYSHPGHDYGLSRLDQHSSRTLPDPISARSAAQTSPLSLLPHQHLDDQHPYAPPHAHHYPSHSHHTSASYSPDLFGDSGAWGQAPSSVSSAHTPHPSHGYASSRERTLTALQIKSEDRSPPPQRPWSTTTSTSPSTSSSTSSHVSHASASGYAMQALSSPFYQQPPPPHPGPYPHQPPTPTSSTPSTSPETYFAPPIPPTQPYGSRSSYDDPVSEYGSSSSSGTLHHYPHDHGHGTLHASRSTSSLLMSRSLPSPHALTSSASAASANPYTLQSISSSNRLSSLPGSGYSSWDRERLGDH